jgi:hypothetical protein
MCAYSSQTSTKIVRYQAEAASPAAADPRIIEYPSIRGGGASIIRRLWPINAPEIAIYLYWQGQITPETAHPATNHRSKG